MLSPLSPHNTAYIRKCQICQKCQRHCMMTASIASRAVLDHGWCKQSIHYIFGCKRRGKTIQCKKAMNCHEMLLVLLNAFHWRDGVRRVKRAVNEQNFHYFSSIDFPFDIKNSRRIFWLTLYRIVLAYMFCTQLAERWLRGPAIYK